MALAEFGVERDEGGGRRGGGRRAAAEVVGERARGVGGAGEVRGEHRESDRAERAGRRGRAEGLRLRTARLVQGRVRLALDHPAAFHDVWP